MTTMQIGLLGYLSVSVRATIDRPLATFVTTNFVHLTAGRPTATFGLMDKANDIRGHRAQSRMTSFVWPLIAIIEHFLWSTNERTNRWPRSKSISKTKRAFLGLCSSFSLIKTTEFVWFLLTDEFISNTSLNSNKSFHELFKLCVVRFRFVSVQFW